MGNENAKKWYEEFKTQLTAQKYDIKNPASSLFLMDMGIGFNAKPGPALHTGGIKIDKGLSETQKFMQGAMPLDNLSDDRIEQLYQLAKIGKLGLVPKDGDFSKTVQITADGPKCEIAKQPEPNQIDNKPDLGAELVKDQSPEAMAERGWKSTLMQEMHMRPQYFSDPELAEERAQMHVVSSLSENTLIDKENKEQMAQLAALEKHPIKASLQVDKTLSDCFKGLFTTEPKLDDLLSAGLIKDDEAMPFSIGNKPWDRIDYVTSEYLSDKPLYMVKPDGTKTVKVTRGEDQAPKPEAVRDKLISPKVKNDAIFALKEVQKQLKNIHPRRNDKDTLEGFKALCDETIESLKKSTSKKDFQQKMSNFAEVASEIYHTNVNKKASKQTLGFQDVVKDVQNIGKCVKEDNSAFEKKLSVEDKQRLDIATKSVMTLAKINAQSNNPDLVRQANEILHNPREMEKQVEAHMKTAAFQTLYGNHNKTPNPQLLANAAVKSSGTDLIKAYNAKVEDLRVEGKRNNIMEEIKAQSRQNRVTSGFVSPEVRADLAVQIKAMKEQLDAMGAEHKTSKEFQDFKKCLTVANLRLQRKGNGYMDVKQQMADLATYADKYYLSTVGKGMNSKRNARFDIVSKIRHMSDAVNENKKPSENLPNQKDDLKADIAAKMITLAAEQLKKMGGPDNEMEANKMLNNPKVFRKRQQEIMNSPEFKAMYDKASEKELQEALTTKAEKINSKLNEKRKEIEKTAHPAEKQKKKEEVEKQAQGPSV